jgi:hypothetical protein
MQFVPDYASILIFLQGDSFHQYDITIDREVEDKYKSYVYEGFENPFEGIYILCNRGSIRNNTYENDSQIKR